MPQGFRFSRRSLRSLPPVLAAVLVAGAGVALAQPRAGAQPPDLSGLWSGGKYGVQPAIPATAYELTAAGKAAYQRNVAGVEAHDPEIDTALKCMPTGYPRAMVGLPFAIGQGKDVLTFVPEADPLARIIYINSTHRTDYWPTYNGDSIGKWEGDTLVIDTVNVIPSTFLDMRGLPHSEELRIVERIRLTGPDEMENQITVSDPKMYVKPFTFTRRFFRSNDVKPVENVCENPRDHPSQPNS